MCNNDVAVALESAAAVVVAVAGTGVASYG